MKTATLNAEGGRLKINLLQKYSVTVNANAGVLEQINFKTLHSALPAEVNSAYASCTDSPSWVGLP